MNPFVAEYVGTFLLLLIGNSIVANVLLKDTKGRGSGWMVITTGWALAVFIGVVVAGPYSGSHLNPAVTLGFALAGLLNWSLVPGYIVAQLLGGMSGAFLSWVLYRDHLKRTESQAIKLAVFANAPAIRNPLRNLFSEILATFVLVFGVFYLMGGEVQAPQGHIPVGLGSVGALPVGFLLWAIGLGLGGTTGYTINPARDLGPRLLHALLPIKGKGPSSDWRYAWVSLLGPLLGGALAAFLYLTLK